MKKKIMTIGIISILLISGLSFLSTAKNIKNDEETPIEEQIGLQLTILTDLQTDMFDTFSGDGDLTLNDAAQQLNNICDRFFNDIEDQMRSIGYIGATERLTTQASILADLTHELFGASTGQNDLTLYQAAQRMTTPIQELWDVVRSVVIEPDFVIKNIYFPDYSKGDESVAIQLKIDNLGDESIESMDVEVKVKVKDSTNRVHDSVEYSIEYEGNEPFTEDWPLIVLNLPDNRRPIFEAEIDPYDKIDESNSDIDIDAEENNEFSKRIKVSKSKLSSNFRLFKLMPNVFSILKSLINF